MNFKHISVALALVLVSIASAAEVTVGAVLASQENLEFFHQAVKSLTPPYGYTYKSVGLVAGRNPVILAGHICDELLRARVVTVVFEVPPETERIMTSVPFTLEFYKIPVVGISSRSSILSNSYAHPYFLRTLPPYSFEAGLWFNALRVLKYNKVVFISIKDVDGEAALNTFRNFILNTDIAYGETGMEITRLIMLEPFETDFTHDLEVITTEDTRVIILAVGAHHAANVYKAAHNLDLLKQSWVWIVSSQAASIKSVPQGILSWKASTDVVSSKDHLVDALRVINLGLTQLLNNSKLENIPSSCSETELSFRERATWLRADQTWWEKGMELYGLYTNTVISDGLTGVLEFNIDGDRKSINYDLINMLHNQSTKIVGKFRTSMNISTSSINEKLLLQEGDIIWPGNQTAKPIGVNTSSYIRVVTIEETPFVYALPFDPVRGCDNTTEEKAIRKCPKHLGNGTTLEFCCYGYLIDMMDRLSVNMSLTFDLHLVHDDKYGTQTLVTNSSDKTHWNGLIGELLTGKADMILAPLVINPERAKYVDFTKPFKFLGITILVKKSTKQSSLGSFLQPFQSALWFLVVVSVFIIALVLYLLDRFSPFGQLQLARDTESEDSLTLSSAVWFAWGVLLNSGVGEGTPKSFSARVLGMVWAGFAMIIVASYTANLAAFLVLDKPEASISGIDDPRLRNPTDNFKFATVKSSSIEEYFRRQVEYTTMYRTMEKHNKNSVEEAIEAVENGELNAFIWDSPRLTYEATKKCDLVTAGEIFGRSSYGIAFAKNSHWTDLFSLTILSYHETGIMEKYDNKWIMQKEAVCDQSDSSPATLGLTNMAGVFLMVGIGIAIGFCILLIEIGYNKYEKKKEQQNNIAKKSVARWKRYVQRKKALRKTWAFIRDVDDSEDVSSEQQRTKLRDYFTGSHTSLNSMQSFAGKNIHPPDIATFVTDGKLKPPTKAEDSQSYNYIIIPLTFTVDHESAKQNPIFIDDNE